MKNNQFKLIEQIQSALNFFGVLSLEEIQDKLELREIFVPTHEVVQALKSDTAKKFFKIKSSDVPNHWKV